MVKRLLPLLMILLLLPLAAGAVSAVNDEAGLYTGSEVVQMAAIIERIRSTYQMDAVVLTTYNVPYSGGDDSVTVRYADAWYEDNGCGLGSDRAGVLFILDMTNRYNYISTAGVMIDYLSDRRIENILSAADDYLYNGQYGAAMIAQLNRLEQYCAAGIEEGSFRYDEVTGERLTGLYNRLTSREALFSAVAGVGVAVAIWFAVMGRYKLKGGTYRYKLGENAHIRLYRDDEQYLRETVSRTRIPDPSERSGGGGGHSGGSGVHTSSGGMSHGGGGHHF